MKEALKLALEALEVYWGKAEHRRTKEDESKAVEAITAIKEALALTSTQCEVQPEQEPVGEFNQSLHVNYPTLVWNNGYVAKFGDKLYTTPPNRSWVRLTEVEKQQMYQGTMWGTSIYGYADAVEAKLKELNT